MVLVVIPPSSKHHLPLRAKIEALEHFVRCAETRSTLFVPSTGKSVRREQLANDRVYAHASERG